MYISCKGPASLSKHNVLVIVATGELQRMKCRIGLKPYRYTNFSENAVLYDTKS